MTWYMGRSFCTGWNTCYTWADVVETDQVNQIQSSDFNWFKDQIQLLLLQVFTSFCPLYILFQDVVWNSDGHYQVKYFVVFHAPYKVWRGRGGGNSPKALVLRSVVPYTWTTLESHHRNIGVIEFWQIIESQRYND